MRLHRLLVPLAAVIVVLGISIALLIVLHSNKEGSAAASNPVPSADLAELLKLKNEAEALAIDNKLAEAHAKYRELFLKGQVQINNPAYWDLMERAKIQQDWIYRILLSRRDPAHVLTPPLPGASTNAVATAPSTTRSFVEVHPPYAGVATAPSTGPSRHVSGGVSATTQATSGASTHAVVSAPFMNRGI